MSSIKNKGWVYRDRVKTSDAGKTILQYYSQKYFHSTEAQWQDRIVGGQITVKDNKSALPTTTETIVREGQQLEYYRLPWYEPEVPLNYEIIYEDRDLVAIAKPPGLPVLPAGNFLQNTLWWQLQQDYPQNTPTPIHRLGRGTSGLMLLARSQLAKSVLSQQMRSNSQENKQIEKIYRTLVTGNSFPDRLHICDRIGKIPHPTLGYIYGATPQGKFARSECQVIQRREDRTLVEVSILTGRPHQIRIHLAAAGYPLMDDPLYLPGGIPKLASVGNKIPLPGDCGYHLHAYRLSFHHPRSKIKMNLKCSAPEELQPFSIR